MARLSAQSQTENINKISQPPICIDSTLPEPNSKSQIEMDRNGMRIAENFSNYPFSLPPELEVKGKNPERISIERHGTVRYGL